MLANEILSWTLQDEAVNSKTDRLPSTYLITLNWFNFHEFKSQNTKLTDEQYRINPGYNVIGLCETSSIASDMLWTNQFLVVSHNIILLDYNNTTL